MGLGRAWSPPLLLNVAGFGPALESFLQQLISTGDPCRPLDNGISFNMRVPLKAQFALHDKPLSIY